MSKWINQGMEAIALNKWKRLLLVFVSLAMLLNCFMPFSFADDNPPPEGFSSWEEYYNSLIGGETTSVEVPPLEEMHLVSENNFFSFYYHEAGADAYILDKRNNKLWSSAVHPDNMDVTNLPEASKTVLLEVGVADKEGAISVLTLNDVNSTGFQLSAEYSQNGVSLLVELVDMGVSFTLKMWIDENGFSYSVPIDSVKETGEGKLISLNLLPDFGAASKKEDGYIFYPDGSGALIDIEKYDLPDTKTYSYPLFGAADPDLEQLQQNEEQDIKGLMLPVAGIKHTNGAFLAAVTEGAENAHLNIYTGETYRTWFQFDYRTYSTVEYNYTGNVFDTKIISELVPNRINQTHTVTCFLLDGENGNYSGMAKAYRDYLKKNGILKPKEKSDEIPLSLDFFMGIAKNGFFFKSYEKLTTFSEAQNILQDIRKSGVQRLDACLTGWAKGGYDSLPTADKPEKALGGSGKLKELEKWCQENQVSLSATADFIHANKNGNYNSKKEALRDWLGKLITDKDGEQFLLNPKTAFVSRVESGLKLFENGATLRLAGIGNLVIPDYRRNEPTSRTEIVTYYTEALQKAAESGQKVTVNGGNAYVLPYADRLYDIPDCDSKYYQNSRSVPFYQMVVHGFVDYTSLAGNMVYSTEYQKLKWIETGSIPHFYITEKNPVLLKKTSYNELFSSEYSAWKDTMLGIYKEFNERLSGIWNQTIDRHEYLSNDVVRITYGNGSAVYLNYGKTQADSNGVSIPPMGYVVVDK